MKTKEDILDECGVRIFGGQKARILKAMQEYADQQLVEYKAKLKNRLDEFGRLINGKEVIDIIDEKYERLDKR